jgi:anhydro-N-acetylmuramic acid kinase
MVYKAIGMMSGSSLDGLDIAYVHFQETAGKWSYELLQTDCYAYTEVWATQLKTAIALPALDYQLLHTAYGRFIGEAVNQFIDAHQLHHRVDLVVSHGHTTFHLPGKQMTAQLGDGAAIAAVTSLPVISDLRALDVAFGGQGAPIVPIGEKLLLQEYQYFLNLGGIANLSFNDPENYIAFDVCPANRVLNMLVQPGGKAFDEDGKIAATGIINQALLHELNNQSYYQVPFPKSLANDYGTDSIYPLIQKYRLSIPDALRTYVEHIALQIRNAVQIATTGSAPATSLSPLSTRRSLLATGGGALNNFMIECIRQQLTDLPIELVVPEKNLVNFKEAMIMALIGVLRWREENNVLASVTGAKRNSVNGAVWMGAEA